MINSTDRYGFGNGRGPSRRSLPRGRTRAANARSRSRGAWNGRGESPAGVILLLSDNPRQTTRVSAVTHKGIARGIQFLWRNYRSPINIPDLAAVAGMSVRGFHKAFVKEVGRKPGDVLRGLRVQRVQELLAGSGHTLKEIAERTGYRNENSLVVAFKRATGASPRKFQRRNVVD